MSRDYELHMVGSVVAQGRPKLTTAPYPHAYDPQKSREFKAMLAFCAQQEMQSKGGEPFSGAVHLAIHVELPVPKSWTKTKRESALEGVTKPSIKPDVDNIAKSIMDALSGVWYLDDKQVYCLSVIKTYGSVAKYHVVCSEVDK